MIGFVAGNPSVDRVYAVDGIRIGAVHRPAVTAVVAGGKGLNAARAAHLLGAEPRVAAILGGRTGQWIEQALKAEGIRGSFVWTNAETRTCVSIGTSDGASAAMTSFYETAAPVGPDAWPKLQSLATEVITDVEVVCLSGSLMPGLPVDSYRRISEIARERDVLVAIDSHGPHLQEALLAGPDLVKINADEAAELLDRRFPESDLLEWAAGAASDIQYSVPGHPVVLITCGPAGIAMAPRTGKRLIGRLNQVGAYPVGSGDAVLGSVAVSMTHSLPGDELLSLALAAGAANAEIPGPGLLDPERVRMLASQASIVPVRPR